MAVKGSFTISGTITGLPDGSVSVGPLTLTLTTAICSVTQVSLSSGDNPITVPAGAQVMVFTPPAANTQAISLKGNAGDTGVPLSKTMPALIPLGTSPVIILNAAGSVAGCEVVFA